MAITLVTLLSCNVPGTSAGVVVSQAPLVTVSITAPTSIVSVDYTIQYTLDDITQSSVPLWNVYSSNYGSSGLHFAGFFSSGFNSSFARGPTVSITTPVAALRLGSSSMSANSVTMQVATNG